MVVTHKAGLPAHYLDRALVARLGAQAAARAFLLVNLDDPPFHASPLAVIAICYENDSYRNVRRVSVPYAIAWPAAHCASTLATLTCEGCARVADKDGLEGRNEFDRCFRNGFSTGFLNGFRNVLFSVFSKIRERVWTCALQRTNIFDVVK